MSTSHICAGCQRPLPKREYLKCVGCKASYDIDCASISSKFFNLMTKKDQWQCPECKSKKPKTGNVNTPVRNVAPADDIAIASPTPASEDNYVTHRKKSSRHTDYAPLSDQDPVSSPEITQNILQKDMLDELKSYMSGIIRIEISSLREVITELTHTIKSQNDRIEKLETKVQELENRKCDHPNIASLESRISDLQVEIYDRDQALLINDIEIAGCPEERNENSTHIVIALAKKIGVDLDLKDVVSAERAGPPPPMTQGGAAVRPRPLVVRLTRRTTRDALLKAARVRRNITTEGLPLPGPTRSIYVNERLTRHYRHLFQKARELSRSHKFKYTWTREGKIFVRQEEGKMSYRLRSEDDLKRVFGQLII